MFPVRPNHPSRPAPPRHPLPRARRTTGARSPETAGTARMGAPIQMHNPADGGTRPSHEPFARAQPPTGTPPGRARLPGLEQQIFDGNHRTHGAEAAGRHVTDFEKRETAIDVKPDHGPAQKFHRQMMASPLRVEAATKGPRCGRTMRQSGAATCGTPAPCRVASGPAARRAHGCEPRRWPPCLPIGW